MCVLGRLPLDPRLGVTRVCVCVGGGAAFGRSEDCLLVPLAAWLLNPPVVSDPLLELG